MQRQAEPPQISFEPREHLTQVVVRSGFAAHTLGTGERVWARRGRPVWAKAETVAVLLAAALVEEVPTPRQRRALGRGWKGPQAEKQSNRSRAAAAPVPAPAPTPAPQEPPPLTPRGPQPHVSLPRTDESYWEMVRRLGLPQ